MVTIRTEQHTINVLHFLFAFIKKLSLVNTSIEHFFITVPESLFVTCDEVRHRLFPVARFEQSAGSAALTRSLLAVPLVDRHLPSRRVSPAEAALHTDSIRQFPQSRIWGGPERRRSTCRARRHFSRVAPAEVLVTFEADNRLRNCLQTDRAVEFLFG